MSLPEPHENASAPTGLRRFGALLFSGVHVALSSFLALAFLPLAPLILPLASARVTRAVRTLAPRPGGAGVAAAVALPLAWLVGSFTSGGTATVLVALVFVLAPAAALHAEPLIPRDRLALLVTAQSGLAALGMLLFAVVTLDADPGVLLARQNDALAKDILAFMRNAGWSEENIGFWAQSFRRQSELVSVAFPGLVLGVLAAYGPFLVYAFERFWAGEPRPIEGFPAFRTPFFLAVAFVPAGAVYALGSESAGIVALNLLIPLAVLFFVRGLAIIRALLDRARLGVVWRALVYLLAFQVSMLVTLGGLLDEFFDFRSRFAKREDGSAS
ncbi:MAG: DUF2232 domain-containing protein [Acidobacteria bacterium]|nr:DUF2232 domain-containing protein [Acidobacteriota bacterium]